MNTRHFDYIIEAAETLNFNKAAANLFISQPALSYQIKAIEEEIGFAVFERRGKSIHLTPAGKQFYQQLLAIRQQLSTAIEQGQNFSSQYSDTIVIGYPLRSWLVFLPEVIHDFATDYPHLLITPEIRNLHLRDDFDNGTIDLLITSREEARKMNRVTLHPLYTSHIYLLVRNEDPLAAKSMATAQDLSHRTLLVNGGATMKLRKVQQQALKDNPAIHTMNSPTHDFTMVQVASGKAVCLSPGYLNDFSQQFTWVPFDTDENFDCVIVSHKDDRRESTQLLIEKLQETYAKKAESLGL